MNGKPRILIVGDAFIDEWIDVDPKPSAEEAPCWDEVGRTRLPGGAANVARQLMNFDCRVSLVTNSDADLFDLTAGVSAGSREYCRHYGRDGVTNNTHAVSRRIRWWDGRRVVMRVDRERQNLPDELRDRLIEHARGLIEDHDVLVLSDYGRGMLSHESSSPLIVAAREKGVPVLVDPKVLTPSDYGGATVAKTNAKYREEFGGRSWMGTPVMVTTRGSGPTESNFGGHVKTFWPASPPAVSTVGAGDCFMAHLALAWARGFRDHRAVEMADRAARDYVTRPFCEPLFPHEAEGTKVVSLKEAVPFIGHRWEGKSIVASNGCFDVLHPGHLATLRWAKEQGERLVVLVNDDDSVRQLKGAGRPHLGSADRCRMLEALEFVDLVVPFEGTDPRPVLDKIGPDILVKGFDNRREDVPVSDGVEVRIAPDLGCSMHSSDVTILKR